MKKKIFAAHRSKQKRPKRLRESGNYSKRNELERLVDLPTTTLQANGNAKSSNGSMYVFALSWRT